MHKSNILTPKFFPNCDIDLPTAFTIILKAFWHTCVFDQSGTITIPIHHPSTFYLCVSDLNGLLSKNQTASRQRTQKSYAKSWTNNFLKWFNRQSKSFWKICTWTNNCLKWFNRQSKSFWKICRGENWNTLVSDRFCLNWRGASKTNVVGSIPR